MKMYGKSLRTWKRLETINWQGKEREIERVYQEELAYREYNEAGEMIGKGSEDFSAERLQNVKTYSVYTWNGEKYNKGGNRWFELAMRIKIELKNRKAAMEIMKKWFPDAAVIELR